MRQLPNYGTIKCNESEEGETIEMKVARIVDNNEPITDGAPIMYTERKDGVRPEHNVRTDRFDMAIDAMSHIDKENTAKRQKGIDERAAALEAKKNTESGKETPKE